MPKIKLFAIAAFLAFAAGAFLFPNNRIEAQSGESVKKRDEILEKVAAYKLWKQVQKPEKKSEAAAQTEVVSISDSTVMGWSFVIQQPSLGSFSRVSSSGGTTRITLPNERIAPLSDKPQKNPHEKGNQTFTRVFANDPANAEIYKDAPKFPVGAIIVREKLLNAEDTTPELVTVMVKREKGFSRKTGDWEYLVVEGGLDKIKQREKAGSCSKCHANAESTDFVFKTYLK